MGFGLVGSAYDDPDRSFNSNQKELGADVRYAQNIFQHKTMPQPMAKYLNVPVFAWKGETLEDTGGVHCRL